MAQASAKTKRLLYLRIHSFLDNLNNLFPRIMQDAHVYAWAVCILEEMGVETRMYQYQLAHVFYVYMFN